MKKVIASIVAATLFLSNAAFLPHSVLVPENFVISASSVESNEYKYTVMDDDSVSIDAYLGSETDVTLPTEIDGREVTSISYDFSSNLDGNNASKIRKLILSKSIKIVDGGPGSYLPNIEEFVMNEGLEKLSPFFLQCSKVNKLEFPSTCVTDFGSGSYFSLLAPELKEINISEDNKYFFDIDGIVYTKDQKALEFCPFKYKNVEVEIPDGCTKIEYKAFFGDAVKVVTIPKSVIEIADYSVGYHSVNGNVTEQGASEIETVPGFKIKCYSGSVAEKYAKGNGIEYELLNNSANSQATLTESELKAILSASSDYDMEGWTYADFDGDGTKEGFAAFVFNSGYSIPSVMRIGFIDADGNITFVSDRQCNALQNAITPTVKIDGKTFICFDTGTGAGYFSLIFGVKNGKPYELKISQHTESLIQGDDGEVYTYRGIGPYGDEKIKLIYDNNSQEFSKPEIYYFTVYQNSGEPVTLYRYTGYAEEIVIPENSLEGATITKISDGEFTEYSEIKSILVPKTIEYIGEKSVGYYRDYFTGESGKVEGLVIKGYSGSAAEKYAKKNGFKFTSLNESSVVKDTDDSNSNDQTIIPAITESDKEMISEVEKYCSDKDYEFRDRINEVLNSNTSWEIKQNELLKILSKYGVNDIQEGMTYLRNRNQKTADALPYVYNYEFLVNDQIYCSSNFYEWLMSSYGMGARMALQTSSLIFNYEIMDVAFGDLFTDDPIGSNPSAKRNKKMLIDFLQDLDSDNNDSFGDKLKDIGDFAEALDKSDDITTLYLPNISSFMKSHLSEFKQYGSPILKFVGATTNDVELLLNMDNQVAIYERNRKFLETIRDSRNVSADMRRAAGSLLDDISSGYENTMKHILGNTCQWGVEMQFAYFNKDLWEVALDELGITNAGSYLATYSVGVFITNALTGINNFTKEVAYSLGYAELSKLYSQKLKSDRQEFLKDQSKEKAWQFFEDYTILWNLRYSGEEQYLESQKVEGLFSSVGTNVQYLLKSLVAEETKSRLKEAKFYVSETIIIPDSVQYMKKAIINCPVDVYVYKGDELVATLKDGTESDVTNSYGRFSVVYNPCTDEYEKVICQSTDDDLDLKIVAVDTGIVNAELAYLDSSDNLKVRSFDNEPISNKDIVELSTDISNNNYTIDKSGDGNIDATKSLNESSNTYTPVTNITCSNDSIEIVVGNNMALDYSVSPDNATYKSVQFVSDDPDIIEVKAGKILAKSVGTTTIYVISSDNSSIKSEIKVNVIEQKHSANGTKKPILIGSILAAVVVIVVIIVYKVRRKR